MKRLVLLAAITSMAGLAGCQSVPDDAAKLGVSFHMTEANRCKTVSPAISVSGTPAGAVTYSVHMVDKQVPTFNHGGGTVPVSAGIPAGALKSFRGPCPPAGSHDYQITVKALDAGGKVIGVGSSTQRFP